MLASTQRVWFAGAFALLLGSGACAGTLDDPARFETQAVSDGGVSDGGLTDGGGACRDIPTLFAQTCSTAGCHGTTDKVQGLDLQSSNVASRLVNVHAAGGGLLIDPTNPSQSVIYAKLTPTPPFGGRMPVGKPLDSATIACVLSWVSGASAGAK